MVPRVLLSALHMLALAIGFAAVFARGRRLRDLARRREDTGALERLFQADNLLGRGRSALDRDRPLTSVRPLREDSRLLSPQRLLLGQDGSLRSRPGARDRSDVNVHSLAPGP